MNAHPRHLPIELDGFLVMDMEDVYNPTFAKTEADAREVYRELDQRSARVFRMADGRHHDVTADFIPDEDEYAGMTAFEIAADRAASRSDISHQQAKEAV